MSISLRKGDVLTESELDDAVHDLVLHALELGMIPIAGILSRKQPDERHEILGFGWNRLREGIPGIHGETGAIINMGRIEGGYSDLTATSSLSPCPFCQCCLALHMGMKQIRILDATNYKPDFSGYAKVGLSPQVSEHPGIVKAFRKWVRDRKNALIWSRDIGIFKGKTARPFDVKRNTQRTRDLMELAHQKAIEGEQAGEAPIGAVIIDSFGEVIGCGHPGIVTRNDPSLVAAMSAWRACGARDHWKDKTLLLTCGPDHIAYSMFHIFNFGQLVLGSDKVFAGRTQDVRRLGVAVNLLRDSTSDRLLGHWSQNSPLQRVTEYLGADFRA
jgi:tRNA(Arg) A34 adenosine deaminase TadA